MNRTVVRVLPGTRKLRHEKKYFYTTTFSRIGHFCGCHFTAQQMHYATMINSDWKWTNISLLFVLRIIFDLARAKFVMPYRTMYILDCGSRWVNANWHHKQPISEHFGSVGHRLFARLTNRGGDHRSFSVKRCFELTLVYSVFFFNRWHGASSYDRDIAFNLKQPELVLALDVPRVNWRRRI